MPEAITMSNVLLGFVCKKAQTTYSHMASLLYNDNKDARILDLFNEKDDVRLNNKVYVVGIKPEVYVSNWNLTKD